MRTATQIIRGGLRSLGFRLLAILLITILVPVFGVEFARLYERQLLNGLEQELRSQVELVRQAAALATKEDVGRQPLQGDRLAPECPPLTPTAACTRAHLARARTALSETPQLQRWLADSARITRTRIRIFGYDRSLIHDSHAEGPPEGHEVEGIAADRHPAAIRDIAVSRWPPPEARPEFERALRGEFATATRVRDSEPRVLMFLAAPIMDGGSVIGVVYATRSTTPVLHWMHRIRSGLYRILAISFAFAFAVALYLLATIVMPLRRLRTYARAWKSRADIPPVGSGEIYDLSLALSEMKHHLQAQADLAANRAADVAHEFKSPLTSIRGAAELLEESASPERAHFAQNIQSDVDRLHRLVNELLVLSRIEASTADRQPTRLRELLERVRERTHTPESPVEIQCPADMIVFARALDLERAILNLAENALRASPANTPIYIEASETPTTIAISVRDAGHGIAEAVQHRVFERFFTTDPQRHGTGLGLAIVQTIATAHDGRVTFTSAPGATVFTLEIPKQ